MSDFLWGAVAATCLAVGVRFLRMWIDSRERLFLFFALSFWSLGAERVGLEIFHPADEVRFYLYLFRLAAFLLILAGIADKNLSARGERDT